MGKEGPENIKLQQDVLLVIIDRASLIVHLPYSVVGTISVIPSWVLVDRVVSARFFLPMCKWSYKAFFFCYLPLWRRLRDIGNLSGIRRFSCLTELNVVWMSHYLCPDLKSDCLPQVLHFPSFEGL